MAKMRFFFLLRRLLATCDIYLIPTFTVIISSVYLLLRFHFVLCVFSCDIYCVFSSSSFSINFSFALCILYDKASRRQKKTYLCLLINRISAMFNLWYFKNVRTPGVVPKIVLSRICESNASKIEGKNNDEVCECVWFHIVFFYTHTNNDRNDPTVDWVALRFGTFISNSFLFVVLFFLELFFAFDDIFSVRRENSRKSERKRDRKIKYYNEIESVRKVVSASFDGNT